MSLCAGVALRGSSKISGKKEQVFFALLERSKSTPDRWYLKNLVNSRKISQDELEMDETESIESLAEILKTWPEQNGVREMVVDLPLSPPECFSCQRACPGENLCPVPQIQSARAFIQDILLSDRELGQNAPKDYELRRIELDQTRSSDSAWNKETLEPLLSRAFRRRLRKGLAPYWNRPLDVWIWSQFYDVLLDTFQYSYDSFGQVSLSTFFRFQHWRRTALPSIQLYESNVFIILRQLLQMEKNKLKELNSFNHFEQGMEVRQRLLKFIEDKLNIFVYQQDQEILIHEVRAFESFLLALALWSKQMQKTIPLPLWASPQGQFLVPSF